jgi:hypothetical protein
MDRWSHQRAENEIQRTRALRDDYNGRRFLDKPRFPTTQRFFTPKVSHEHPYSWNTGPYKDEDEYDEQVATFKKLYSFKTQGEQRDFYDNLEIKEKEFLGEQDEWFRSRKEGDRRRYEIRFQ